MVFIFIFGVNRFQTVAHTHTHTHPTNSIANIYKVHSHSKYVPLKFQQHFTMNFQQMKKKKKKKQQKLHKNHFLNVHCAHIQELYLCLDVTCNLQRPNNQKIHKESVFI